MENGREDWALASQAGSAWGAFRREALAYLVENMVLGSGRLSHGWKCLKEGQNQCAGEDCGCDREKQGHADSAIKEAHASCVELFN